MRIKTTLIALLPGLLATIGGCTTTTYESYRPVANRQVDIAYVAASADFSQYRRLMVEEMGIFFPTHAPPSDEDLARIRGAFRNAFLPKMQEYEIVDEAAADVLIARASLVDLRNTAADRLPNLSSDINEILRPGQLTFVIELSDSLTNNALLRAADTERSPEIDVPDDGSPPSEETLAAAEYWAGLLHAFLDQNLGGRSSQTE